MDPSVLILTPVKDAEPFLDGYFRGLELLDYPPKRLSLGLLESDSRDSTHARVAERLPELRARYSRVTLLKRDFGFRLPKGGSRWAPALQVPRRVMLARSRNHLLFAALREEDWVLWLDVDVIDYPRDVLRQLLATGKDVVTAHCVWRGGHTFDCNAWRDRGETRMDSLRDGPELVRLDGVGAAMLLVRADVHREGLVFPAFPYGRSSPFARAPRKGEVESEGLGLMAKDMGYECWGMPRLEVVHWDG